MSLSPSRVVFQGETPYAHEREAIDFTIASLPDNDKFHLWALLELLDPSTGRMYELDMLVLGYNALYLVEIKSGPGRYEGDHQDWYRTPPGETRPRYMENPYRLNNHKAKVLASRLKSKMKDPRKCPWIEPLVFLSHEEAQLHFRNHGNMGVVTRKSLVRAVTHHEFPGVENKRSPRPIGADVARDVARAIEAIGLRPRKGKAHVGSYELGELISEGEGFQDRHAEHRDQSTMTRRARIYLVPAQSSVERRQQLRRAADREAQLLQDVRDHGNILRINDYVTDAPLGPTVLFDPFEGAVSLSTFLRQNADLEFAERVSIIEQVGRALAHCHRKGIVHGAVSPEAVLVRRRPEGEELETRLFNFQLGRGDRVEATSHWSALADDKWGVYQAPELRGHSTTPSVRSDMFSLGALAFFTFTGQAPAANVVELERHLLEARHLDPRSVTDGIQEKIAELVESATARSPVQRDDDAETWVELLLEFATEPELDAGAAIQDPLEARAGETLGEDLLVDGVLGQGATSRVLRVLRASDNRDYALKIALDEAHHERFQAEATSLGALRHPRIVQCIEQLTLGGRSCLLLSLAGSETLHRYLAREGTVSLDLAARYGEDLLSALEYLEERQVMHRDIKPANLGVGTTAKTAAHLTLFDMSLVSVPPKALEVGTAAYRDPFLVLRGAWDYAAERWSAGVTLHEMLTGVRPGFEEGHGPLDPEPRPSFAAERFDASVRGALVAFFERAFAPDHENRFASAEEMRRAWIAALDTTVRASPDAEGAKEPAADALPEEVSDEELSEISPDTPIEALPLSNRARNALDRAGLLRAEDLLALADNRLSAIRGIGTRVARDILAFRDRWQAARKPSEVETMPFFGSYRGDDLQVHTAGVAEELASALSDAGLNTLSVIAAAPRHQVEALAKRHGVEPKTLRDLLDRENRGANERERPSTLEGWIDALLPRRKRGMKHPRALFGIDGELAGRLDVSVRELAERLGVTTPAIYIALGKARKVWAQHGAIGELLVQAQTLVGRSDGALPLPEAAARLLGFLPHDRTRSSEALLAEAGALLRVAADVQKDDPHGLSYQRGSRGQGWLLASDGHARAIRELGNAADRLAERSVVPGPGEVARVLSEAVEDTPLATASRQRLVELATKASDKAARSARLEIYPKGMASERALTLSASLLRSGLSEEEVLALVTRRYPDAAPLPTRPELDALLAPHGLQWNGSAKKYVRPGLSEGTSLHTRFSTVQRAATALPSEPRSMEPGPVRARRFDEQLRSAVERRQFRLLGVRADQARKAALQIGERIGVGPTEFDRRLVAAIRAQVETAKLREEIVHEADRAGPYGPAWNNLQRLIKASAEQIEAELLASLREEPLLLVQPGLLQRYGLGDFLRRLVEASKDPDTHAIFILVPSVDAGGIPRINGELAVPGVLPSQALWVASEWLANLHNAAA